MILKIAIKEIPALANVDRGQDGKLKWRGEQNDVSN